MTNYISEIMRELGFEKEAYDSLHADFLKIQENAFAKAEFEDCIREYSKNFKCDYGALLKKADTAAVMRNWYMISWTISMGMRRPFPVQLLRIR